MTRPTTGSGLRRVLPLLLVASVAVAACDAPAGGTPAATGSPVPATAVTSPSATAVPSATTTSPAPAAGSAKPKISKAALAYFFAVALGTEYGDKVSVVTMWTKPEVTVRVHGSAGKSGKGCLDRVIADFNALTATTDLKLTTNAADLEFYFAPLAKFRSIEPNYVSGNDGYVYVHWSGSHAITGGTVLIRSSGISEGIRCHLIREELTQGMGLLRDSYKYPNSVFYGEYYPAPTRYSALDKELIRLLYSGAVRPGDDKKTVTSAVTVK